MTAARRSAPTFALLAALSASALLFSGCASAVGPASGGTPAASAVPLQVEAGWLDGGRQIALVTWGSSGCVPQASDASVQVDGTIAVTLDDGPADRACTSDFAPRVTLVPVPEGVDPAKDLALVVTGGQGERGETDLAGAAGLVAGGTTDYAPSAGRIDDELIALLTWGSSSCAPTVESVTAAAPSTVAVTFAALAADKACTMDMAPRALLVSVGGLDVSGGVTTVTLSGGDAQFATAVSVPVIG